MFEALMQWDILQKIIINTLFVSIPEEIYWVMFTLILAGEFEYWKEPECKKLIHSWDYGRILIPAVIAALLSNILRYAGLDFGFISLIPLAVCYIAIVLTNDVFGDASALKWMGRVFIFFIIGFMSIGISEFIYVPFILYGTGKTIQEINNDILINFLVSIPAKIIQFSILLYFVSRKRTLLKGNLFSHIFSSPVLSVLSSMIIAFDLSFLFIAYKLIVYEEILVNIPHVSRFTIIVGVILFPILNISAFIWGVYYMKNREMIDKKAACEKLVSLLNEIKSYANNENYDNIKWKLNELGMGIEGIAISLYEENRKTKK